MKLYVEEIRKGTYRKIFVWVPGELPYNAKRVWEFSSNKARLVCQLLNNHGLPVRLLFNNGFSAESEASEELIDVLDKLSRIERNFTSSIYERLSQVTDNLDKFKEELAPFILELELKN